MKKIILIMIVFTCCVASIFSFNPVSPSVFTIDFTAGLIANLGFTSKSVSSMIYPSDTILTDSLAFTFNPATERFETGTFYVFCQVFSPDVSSVSLKGTRLKSDSETSSIEIEWIDTINQLKFTTTDTGYEATIIGSETSVEPPKLYCYEMNLQISRIPEGADWSKAYSGSLTLNIVSK